MIEPGNLPVSSLLPQTLEYLLQIDRYLQENVNYDVYDGFNPVIDFNCNREPISYIARLTISRQITVSEPYLAFLWSLCYCFVIIKNEIKSEKLHLLDLAVNGLRYGKLLFTEWHPWPSDYPSPIDTSNQSNAYIKTANSLFSIATCFIILHEYSHQSLGHDLESSPELAHSEEFQADMNAMELMMNNNVEGIQYTDLIPIGVIIGIGSILFADEFWSSSEEHPDSEERLSRILYEFQRKIGDQSWHYGQFILIMWGLIHNYPGNEDVYKGTSLTNYDAYQNLKQYYKSLQINRNNS